MSILAKPLLQWFDRHGRHDLPWQHNIDAYRVWISEIMLQQTQVTTAIPYYKRFIARFPHVQSLAEAPIDDVLHLWSGLGYYARARNLHRTAGLVVKQYGGEFPNDIDALTDLPGIGRSTAGAILSLAFQQRQPILDGNVKRVLARYHEVVGWPGKTAVMNTLWEYAELHTPHARIGDYTQAIMDLGATVCVRSNPRCDQCPLAKQCAAFANGTQTKFPGKKPRKALPEKRARFVVPRAPDGSILLWRRPPSGIWGGLWSCPEMAPNENIAQWCRAQGLHQRADEVIQESLTHTFTHFRLTIEPLLVEVDHSSAVMDSDSWLWYNVDAPARVGIAKPVQKILSTIK